MKNPFITPRNIVMSKNGGKPAVLPCQAASVFVRIFHFFSLIYSFMIIVYLYLNVNVKSFLIFLEGRIKKDKLYARPFITMPIVI